MGAHTVGQFVQSSQMYKYWWNRGEHSYFNNEYYKTMTATQDYIIRSPDNVRTFTIYIYIQCALWSWTDL